VNTKRGDAPSNLRSLETRISNVAREQGRPVRRVQRAVANTVIGQMLPPGVVKAARNVAPVSTELLPKWNWPISRPRSSRLA
jgi:hypothetical protein